MKQFLFFILISLFALFCGVNKILAQKVNQKREVIIIEFSALNMDNEKFEISIPKNKFVGEGNRGFSECLFCKTPEEFANFRGYDFSADALRLNKNSTKIIFQIEFNDCKIRKSFIVNRNQKRQLKLRCGANLIAYYGFETEEAN